MSIQKIIDDSNKIATKINSFKNLKDYRELIQQANEFGERLWEFGLATNQIEEFLKIMKKLKGVPSKEFHRKVQSELSSLKNELSKPAKQYEVVKALKNVVDAAVDKVKDSKDFEHLVELIELTSCIDKEMIRTIKNLTGTLGSRDGYSIRKLIKHTEDFGYYLNLKNQELKTNQIRKFLDTMNRIKVNLKVTIASLARSGKADDEELEEILLKNLPGTIDVDLVLLKQKLAYASARQSAVKPLKEVMDSAIDKVHYPYDFERLFQLVESIIAYHKVAGGN